MLFVFPRSVRNPFTMEQMYFPLDMVFLDGGGTIVDIIKGAKPQEGGFVASGSFQFVLELNAGAVGKHGIKPGDQMLLTGVSPPFLPIGE